jgi:glycosyltransferase involved in cell wall biosynthesis
VRILLSIHHALDPDQGAPGATLALGHAYEELGHTTSYLSFDDLPGRLPELGKELLFPEFAAMWLPRHARRVDVVDASAGDAWLWANLARRRAPAPLLVTRTHGLEHRFWEETVREAARTGAALSRRTRLYHGGARLREVSASLRLSDECLFLNGDDLEYAVSRLGIAREHAHIVRNGLPASFLGRPLIPAGDAPVRIAVVGTYAERKGARYATAALARVLGERHEVDVGFYGTGVEPERVRADFPAEVRKRVRVLTRFRHEELPALLDGSTVLLSTSLAEGFSLALPEAMACGLAPVATAISGAREIVRDGENGLLVRPRDVDAAAAAIRRLADDRPLLERLRAAAHASAQQLCWKNAALDSLAVYERGLARVSPSRA